MNFNFIFFKLINKVIILEKGNLKKKFFFVKKLNIFSGRKTNVIEKPKKIYFNDFENKTG
jgi:hypothetical protein